MRPRPERPAERVYVLVQGWPAAGKSTVAAALAEVLGLPLLVKDAVKESLSVALGPPADVESSRRLGRAAVHALLRVARTSPGAVIDSTFYGYAQPLVRDLPGRIVEVRCLAPLEVVRERYAARAAGRDAVHLDDERTEDELWGRATEPLGLGPSIDVDTTGPLDIGALAAAVRSAAGA